MNRKQKLAIVTTHPVQYNAPLFRLLTQRQQVEINVFYTWEQAKGAIYDPGFGHTRQWDISLLDGYRYSFVRNTATQPGSHHFRGIKNPGLVNEIEAWGADAVLVYGWSFWSHLACLRYFKGRVPVFFRGDSTLLDEKWGIKSFARRLFLRRVYQYVDRAFFVGRNNKAYFRAHGLQEDRLVFAPHAVDNNRFGAIGKEEEKELACWRDQLKLAENDFVVLFVGKFEDKKAPQFLLELAIAIPTANIKFLLVGNGPLEGTLKEQRRNSQVIFLPFQNQSKMPLVYRLGNVLVLPSKGPGETWGLAANEAMACGLPVILSDKVGSVPDLVGDKNTGIVFSGNDVGRVAGYICSLQKDRGFYQQVCQNARQHIQAFSFEKIAMAIEEQMQKISAI
ncbi:glycosyltransferase family 4 protein [Flavisolibacter sp. BT320]|nr:glycosyltransferase family 4 protein [Flavisolibacter longurius]